MFILTRSFIHDIRKDMRNENNPGQLTLLVGLMIVGPLMFAVIDILALPLYTITSIILYRRKRSNRC